jgi:hypothetical protein
VERAGLLVARLMGSSTRRAANRRGAGGSRAARAAVHR